MRPRFSRPVAAPAAVMLSCLRTGVAGPRVAGSVSARHAEIAVPAADRRVYSPWLSLEVEATEHGSQLHARFGPGPHVWTLVVAMYSVCCFGGVAACMYGLSQMTMGDSPTALWGMPVAGLLASVVYAGGFLGRRLGHEQMVVLARFLADSVACAEGGIPPEPALTQHPDEVLGRVGPPAV